MSERAIKEVRNPTCVAWEWTDVDEEEGIAYCHQILWLHGTHSLYFCVKTTDGKWLQTPIDNPQRFGFKGTLKSARAAAENFIHERELIDD